MASCSLIEVNLLPVPGKEGSSRVGLVKWCRSRTGVAFIGFIRCRVYIMTIITQLSNRWRSAMGAVLHGPVPASALKEALEMEQGIVSLIEFGRPRTSGSGRRLGLGELRSGPRGIACEGGVPPPIGSPRPENA